MYRLLCSTVGRPCTHLLYALWYASLVIAVYYFFDRDAIEFYYLRR